MSGDWTRTTCPYCGVGCGVLAKPATDGSVAIKGDGEHPANFGRLCSKGTALGETVSLDGRLLEPMVDDRTVSWGEALDVVASRFTATIAEHGAESVALYVSGQLLTEDYYAANKFVKGYIGTANIDTNSRLCMASSVAGHKRAFGTDTVPGTYEDLETADLVVLTGSNLAWCHPVLFQRLVAAREANGTRIVVIDPRRTATCEIADTHLAIAPGTDVALFNGLLSHLEAEGLVDTAFVSAHTQGFAAALDAARQMDIDAIASLTGLSRTAIQDFYALVARTPRTVTVFSQGVNQSTAGTDKVNSIINCHLATGRIGKPGMGPFSVTGQPNAMGGREVGGLANMLAAHMELGDAEHRRIVQTFWQSPAIAEKPGLKAVDLFKAVRKGQIKALWIIATNPVVSLPEADEVKAALDACPFVVVSDVNRNTDTMAYADVALPSAAWGEKDGTVTNSERRISRQRAFLPTPGQARPDWWQVGEIAKRMGFGDGFPYTGPDDIFREYAALTGAENDGSRDLDFSGLKSISREIYADLAPFQWPKTSTTVTDEVASPSRFFADGRFFTPDRRARIIATPYRAPANATTPVYPLRLNTGRVRDHWHTMTRTGKSPRLAAHYAEPFVEINPEDAVAFGLRAAGLAEVESINGRVVVRTVVTDRQRKGSVFVPMHWSGEFASNGRVDVLVSAATDPVSGQPELKATPVAVRPYKAQWHAFAVTTERPAIANFGYAAIAPVKGGWRAELADRTEPEDWGAMARELLLPGSAPADASLIAYEDRASGTYRFAAFGERCLGLLYVSRGPVEVARSWAVDQLMAEFGADDASGGELERLLVLSGRPGTKAPDRGPVVCACLGVGKFEIIDAITERGLHTVAEIGECLGAGTNCGSCRSEIAALIARHRIAVAV